MSFCGGEWLNPLNPLSGITTGWHQSSPWSEQGGAKGWGQGRVWRWITAHSALTNLRCLPSMYTTYDAVAHEQCKLGHECHDNVPWIWTTFSSLAPPSPPHVAHGRQP
mmetsp:Transcript_121130/g.210644  ORF Transcript_121130/g.210644 Transcript_121130/m.210644 type:complete len:108 (-) Transcript_121130:754-1077(-)